jgi:hypothetical protein
LGLQRPRKVPERSYEFTATTSENLEEVERELMRG